MTKDLTNAEILAAIDHSLRETWRAIEAAKGRSARAINAPLQRDLRPASEASEIKALGGRSGP
jgi:hypothetical protein